MGKQERAAADPIRHSNPAETSCPDCGGQVPGGVAGCRALFGELQIRNQKIGDLNLLRLAVDSYCLQHPEPYMHSKKSQTAHLVSMCWQLEFAASPAVWKALRARLEAHSDEPNLPVPEAKARISLADVFPVDETAAYRNAVREWAIAAWAVWTPHHALVRGWIQAAIAGKK